MLTDLICGRCGHVPMTNGEIACGACTVVVRDGFDCLECCKCHEHTIVEKSSSEGV